MEILVVTRISSVLGGWMLRYGDFHFDTISTFPTHFPTFPLAVVLLLLYCIMIVGRRHELECIYMYSSTGTLFYVCTGYTSLQLF